MEAFHSGLCLRSFHFKRSDLKQEQTLQLQQSRVFRAHIGAQLDTTQSIAEHLGHLL
jgi:hypothetical protein